MNIKRTNEYGGSFVYCAAHIDTHIPNLYGDCVETPTDEPCPDCEKEQRSRELPGKVREALLSASHTRYNRGAVYIYCRDATSPSGVILSACIDEHRFDDIYTEMVRDGLISSSLSPLSPTER